LLQCGVLSGFSCEFVFKIAAQVPSPSRFHPLSLALSLHYVSPVLFLFFFIFCVCLCGLLPLEQQKCQQMMKNAPLEERDDETKNEPMRFR